MFPSTTTFQTHQSFKEDSKRQLHKKMSKDKALFEVDWKNFIVKINSSVKRI